jgi:hypothetical protein
MSDHETIDVECPHCQQRLRIPAINAGKAIYCPDCNGVIQVPGKTGITEEAPKPHSKPADHDPYDKPSRRRASDYEDDPYDGDRRRDDDDFAADIRRQRGSDVGGRVLPPAICMLIVAIIGLLLNILGVVMAIAGEERVDPNAPPFLQEFAKNQHGPLAASIQGSFALLSLATIVGSIQMMRRKTWGLSLTASVLSMVNIGNCCCLFGLPFGIWALVALVNPDVKDAFS